MDLGNLGTGTGKEPWLAPGLEGSAVVNKEKVGHSRQDGDVGDESSDKSNENGALLEQSGQQPGWSWERVKTKAEYIGSCYVNRELWTPGREVWKWPNYTIGAIFNLQRGDQQCWIAVKETHRPAEWGVLWRKADSPSQTTRLRSLEVSGEQDGLEKFKGRNAHGVVVEERLVWPGLFPKLCRRPLPQRWDHLNPHLTLVSRTCPNLRNATLLSLQTNTQWFSVRVSTFDDWLFL